MRNIQVNTWKLSVAAFKKAKSNNFKNVTVLFTAQKSAVNNAVGCIVFII